MEGCGPPRFSLSAAAADVGASSPWRGRTYFACNERGGGGVLVAYSPVAGEAWNQPVAIRAAQSDTVQLHQVMGMAVSEDGVLGVTWIGRTGPQRDDFPNPCYEVFFSASVDGGDSFLPEQRISTGRSCATLAINGAAARGAPAGGDYYGMVATSEGRFQVLWPETRGAVYQLLIATIEVR